MPLRCGVDIIEINRIKKSIEAAGKVFIEKVYTSREIEYCEEKKRNKYQSYAVRFAAKEAVSKAFGTGIGKDAGLKEIEILNNESGCPYVNLEGKAKEKFLKINAKSISISLSHCDSHAVAYAVIETK